MIAALTNHLWQSTLFAVAAALLTLTLRRNRAHIRYWLWFSASLKLLVPFALLIALGGQFRWTHSTPAIAAPATVVSITVDRIAEPFLEPPRASSPVPPHDWLPALLAVWACGFAAVAMIRLRAWRRVRSAIRASVPFDLAIPVDVRTSPGLLEPGVVGFVRPVLLLPAGIADRLSPPELEAVLAHELCHIRRRDNLYAAVHMLVEAAFWFHQLVWWIGARLLEERERACDEEVLRQGSQPGLYAQAILNVCKLYVESPLVCVSGVTGADLKKRIEAIMTNRTLLRLNAARKLALAATAAVALAAPIVIGILNAPAIRAQSVTAKFEVASVKPCAGGGGRGARGSLPATSPGRLDVTCDTLVNLIHQAYLVYANAHFNPDFRSTAVEGGDPWIRSDHFEIHAKAEEATTQEMMKGPMMQALLEDRFKLKVRSETREIPIYALTVAKSGLKIKPAVEGSCINRETLPPEPPRLSQPLCGGAMFSRKGPNLTLRMFAVTIDGMANGLGTNLDRRVVDKTGLTAKYDIRLDFAPDEATRFTHILENSESAALDEPRGPSLFTALEEQLGLKLEPAKGPVEFLVVDHVEKLVEN